MFYVAVDERGPSDKTVGFLKIKYSHTILNAQEGFI